MAFRVTLRSLLLGRFGTSRTGGEETARKLPISFAMNFAERSRIADYPEAGAVAEDIDLAGVRRVILVDTQHYVYYRVNRTAETIEVLAVWSTKFGEPPSLH